MNPELLGHSLHADAAPKGCSHSVHFLVREPCLKSFAWFRRCTDQGVVSLTLRVGIVASPLIPRGNEPLNWWSSVPAAPNCFHPMLDVQTRDVSGLMSSPVRSLASSASAAAWSAGSSSVLKGSPGLASTTSPPSSSYTLMRSKNARLQMRHSESSMRM